MNNITKKYTVIPAKPEISLSQEVYDYLVWLVPKGKLTTETIIRNYLMKTLNCGWIDFQLPVLKYSTIDGFAVKLIDLIPHHRIVSTLGYVYNPVFITELTCEGFTLEESKGNRDFRVKNYKKYLFNFDEVENLDKNLIMRIQNEGIENFILLDLEE